MVTKALENVCSSFLGQSCTSFEKYESFPGGPGSLAFKLKATRFDRLTPGKASKM
jgi:hypothetical protein